MPCPRPAQTFLPNARKAIARLLPAPQLPYRIVRRIAGVGSLGHPHYVAVFDWQGGQIALEAKAAIPSACLWARPVTSSRIYYQLAMEAGDPLPRPFRAPQRQVAGPPAGARFLAH